MGDQAPPPAAWAQAWPLTCRQEEEGDGLIRGKASADPTSGPLVGVPGLCLRGSLCRLVLFISFDQHRGGSEGWSSLLETLGMCYPLGLSLPICDVGRLTYHTGVSEHIWSASAGTQERSIQSANQTSTKSCHPATSTAGPWHHSGPASTTPHVPRAGLLIDQSAEERLQVCGVGVP